MPLPFAIADRLALLGFIHDLPAAVSLKRGVCPESLRLCLTGARRRAAYYLTCAEGSFARSKNGLPTPQAYDKAKFSAKPKKAPSRIASVEVTPEWQASLNRALLSQITAYLGQAFLFRTTPEGAEYWAALRTCLMHLHGLASAATASNYPAASWSRESGFAAGGAKAEFRTQGLWYKPGQAPHHDPQDPTLVRFVKKSGSYAEAKPKWITSKPGKFLEEFYGAILSPPHIAKLAAEFRAAGLPPEVKFAKTPAEIEAVYEFGPSSCMSGNRSRSSAWAQHPTCAYGSGEFAVAATYREGRPNSRGVVHLPSKTFYALYGATDDLKKGLVAGGFKLASGSRENGVVNEWKGARLLAVRHPSYILDKPAHGSAGRNYPDWEPVCLTPFGDAFAYGRFEPWAEGEAIPEGAAEVGAVGWLRLLDHKEYAEALAKGICTHGFGQSGISLTGRKSGVPIAIPKQEPTLTAFQASAWTGMQASERGAEVTVASIREAFGFARAGA